MYVELGAVSGEQVERFLALCRSLDLSPGPGGSRITPVGELIADFREALAWTSEYTSHSLMSVVALYPSSQLVAHCDPPTGKTRCHIPLVINDGCWVFHGGTWQQLAVGTLYQMDQTTTHGAVNWGAEVRLHLIVDVQ